MGIFRRVGKLISADIHGLLDVLEEPVDTCKHAIREMEEELGALREAARSRNTRLEKLAEQLKRSVERTAELDRQLALCLTQSDDTLTRAVLKKKIEQEKLRRFVEKQRESLAAEGGRTSKQIAEYEERIAAIKDKLACFSNRAAAEKPLSEESTDSLAVSEDEIEIALLQAKSGQGTAQQGRQA